MTFTSSLSTRAVATADAHAPESCSELFVHLAPICFGAFNRQSECFASCTRRLYCSVFSGLTCEVALQIAGPYSQVFSCKYLALFATHGLASSGLFVAGTGLGAFVELSGIGTATSEFVISNSLVG